MRSMDDNETLEDVLKRSPDWKESIEKYGTAPNEV